MNVKFESCAYGRKLEEGESTLVNPPAGHPEAVNNSISGGGYKIDFGGARDFDTELSKQGRRLHHGQAHRLRRRQERRPEGR